MAKSKGVIFAVNDYAPVGPGGSDLQGCVNDAEDMANTLHILGFPKSRIRVYTDKRATVRRMRAQLEWLVKDAKPGDRLIFYYSGHGSQVPDIDLDGTEDFEADEQDEILVLHDHDWEGNFISDDEFAAAFKNIPDGVNLDVIMDCCFSGSATRSIVNPLVGAFTVAGDKPEIKRSRYMSPPIDFAFHLSRADVSRNPIVETTKNSNHTLWSASQEFQTSQEYLIDGNVRGAFTYHLCKILRASKGEDNRELVYTTLRDAMSRGGDEQVPRIDSNDRMLALKPFSKTLGKVIQAENAEYQRLQAARKGKSGIFGGELADVKISHNTMMPTWEVSTQPLETARTEENMMLSLGHNIVSTVKPKSKKRGKRITSKQMRRKVPDKKYHR